MEPSPFERLGDAGPPQAAHAGHDELQQRLKLHTEPSPVLTAGDVDARWEDAYAGGDETPGGDNPQGGDEIAERDRHRWKDDPASSDDWPHN